MVVDSNVLAHLHLPGDFTKAAEALLAGPEYEVDSISVLELVRDSDCSAYDGEFMALADRLDVKLVTMDKQLLKAFPSRTRALHARCGAAQSLGIW